MILTMSRTGTREWSNKSLNCYKGCKNNCRYCYGASNALRFNQIKKRSEWANPILNENKFFEKPRKIYGVCMFPTVHDITPDTLQNCIHYMEKWLAVGNNLLIVTKPSLSCITRICEVFKSYKKQIMFRFTIGSYWDNVLTFWDRNAPLYQERFSSLVHAYNEGWDTSISMEPYLDGDVVALFYLLKPYVTDTIWIGKMNQIRQRVDKTDWHEKGKYGFTGDHYMEKIIRSQDNNMVRSLYSQLNHEPEVRWKDSIRNVLGLPEYEQKTPDQPKDAEVGKCQQTL